MESGLGSDIKGTVFPSTCFVSHEQAYLEERKSCGRRKAEWCSFQVRNDAFVGHAKLICGAEQLI